MRAFEKFMKCHQAEWRESHVISKQFGAWRDRQYPWLLPKDSWEEGLWEGISSKSENSLSAYLRETGVQKHTYAHHLNSSWTLCANLYFPFRETTDSRAMLASFLKHYVAEEIETLEGIELEYAENGELHPSRLLGEMDGTRGRGQTSPDLGLLVNGGRGIILVESKFTEHSFYECSAWRHKGSSRRLGNPNPDRCNHPMDIVKDPTGQCHQAAWGRRYWDHLAPIVDEEFLNTLPHCPAAQHGYQLFRQQALAEGIAQSGCYDLVVSSVAFDERNDSLNTSLKSSGIAELRSWGAIFKGTAQFAIFTHQQWVGWVEEHDTSGKWDDWLRYVRSRYDL